MIHLPDNEDSAAGKTNQADATESVTRCVGKRSNDARDEQQR